MRRWLVTWLLGSALALVISAAGCSPYSAWDHCPPGEDCPDTEAGTEPLCADICIPEGDDGFTGPNWYWLGSPADMPRCPDAAPFDGISAFTDASPAVEPPCAATQSVKWGFIARECKITTHDTCEFGGQVCAPLPPEGYSLCVYHDDETECRSAYPKKYHLLREKTDQACAGMGVEPVTLCCAEPHIPG